MLTFDNEKLNYINGGYNSINGMENETLGRVMWLIFTPIQLVKRIQSWDIMSSISEQHILDVLWVLLASVNNNETNGLILLKAHLKNHLLNLLT